MASCKHPLNVRADLQHLSYNELVKIYKESMNKDKVCCLNLTGDTNIGQIIRTASLFVMSEVIIVGRRFYDRRTTVGTHNYIPTTTLMAAEGDHSEKLVIPEILKLLTEWSETHNIFFVEFSDKAIPLNKLHDNIYNAKPAMFVMGTEHDGIPQKILDFKPSICVKIPQKGVGPCFNVSNAFAMVAWEYYRT